MSDQTSFISLLSDYGFKVVFADETDTTFLRRALQAVIQSNSPIQEVEFLSNEFIGSTLDGRSGIYDLVCKDEAQRTFIVEMQLGHYKHYIQRSKFYAFKKFDTMVKKGGFRFNDFTPIYSNGFLVHPIFHHSKAWYHYGTLKNQFGEKMDDQMVHIIIEIAKFDKQESEIKTDLGMRRK